MYQYFVYKSLCKVSDRFYEPNYFFELSGTGTMKIDRFDSTLL